MTVHVISVGLSLLDSLGKPHLMLADKPDLIGIIRRERPQDLLTGFHPSDKAGVSGWLGQAFTPAEGASGTGPRAMLMAIVETVKPELWPDRSSAELDTFARAAPVPGAGRPLAAGDIAVLVCSDTPAGLTAGLWNAVALTGDLGRVQYIADPRNPAGAVRDRAVMARVPGMDASNEDGFRQAMAGLGTLGRQLRESGGEEFRFYLSGGFKAAIPYLIGLAEGLNSQPGAGPVSAWVLHETALGQPPIRLPLRRMAPTRVQYELEGLSEVPSRTPPPSDFLNGYAYEETGNGWSLTAFGVGLKALFGIPPSGLGT